jgi:hypothetical protein
VVISSDGHVGIVKIEGGAQSVISGGGLNPNDAILQGHATHAIRLDCVGESLTLHVDGTQAVGDTDARWASGDVGLVAGPYNTHGTDVSFDNLIVREP